MKRYILFPFLLALPLSLAAQSTIRRPSKPKVENSKSKPSPKTKPKLKPVPTINLQVELSKLINNMVYVSGGTFAMGATSEQGNEAMSWEKPAHSVTLTNFYLSKYEVSQSLWKAVMGNNPSDFRGESLPVENVNWYDCQTFISRLNSLTGKNFRLPTEAEWEYAARGGNRSQGFKYSGSNNLSDVAWYEDNSCSRTHPVGSKSPNELGLYDMSGNVWEWCSDWFGTYSSSSQTNPAGPSSGSSRVRRGGGWRQKASDIPVYRRFGNLLNFSCDNLGFRLALSE